MEKEKSFLGIYSNNLDEFFRVRMASLNRLALSKDKNIKADRERAKKTIKDIKHLPQWCSCLEVRGYSCAEHLVGRRNH